MTHMANSRLGLLQIDDDVRPNETSDEVLPGLERICITGDGIDATHISGLRDASAFWSWFREGHRHPDLLVGDVRFLRADSTPLSLVTDSESQHVDHASGLSHLAAMSAMSLASNRPLGISFYSAGCEQWREMLRSSDLVHRAAALSALHQIAVIASIVDDPVDVPLVANSDLLDDCLEWFEGYCKTSCKEAQGAALSLFR